MNHVWRTRKTFRILRKTEPKSAIAPLQKVDFEPLWKRLLASYLSKGIGLFRYRLYDARRKFREIGLI